MKSNIASGVLTALIYAQVLLCFAGAATVLWRERVQSQNVASESVVPTSTPTAIRL
jgi:hypothetical protein